MFCPGLNSSRDSGLSPTVRKRAHWFESVNHLEVRGPLRTSLWDQNAPAGVCRRRKGSLQPQGTCEKCGPSFS